MQGRKLLEKVHHQARPGNELRWLPWEQLMNQEQEEEAVRLKTKNRVPGSDWGMFMHLLWEDQMKIQDGQMSGAPFFISRLQTVRRNAYSMCTDVHLQVWKKLDMEFLTFYTKRYSSNLRAPRQPGSHRGGSGDVDQPLQAG